jgi:hypothetical protein
LEPVAEHVGLGKASVVRITPSIRQFGECATRQPMQTHVENLGFFVCESDGSFRTRLLPVVLPRSGPEKGGRGAYQC